MSGLGARWARAVPALRHGALRVSFVRYELVGHGLDEVARALDHLAGKAEQADEAAREVLAAAAVVIADPALGPRVEALRSHAAANALLPLVRLLRRRTAAGGSSAPPGPDERPLPRGGGPSRPLTLGERKSLARRSSRTALDRLLRDPHPVVIQNVLLNPRLTEDDVVRLAARRPTFPDVQTEIARHPDWSQRTRVRRALVQNPFTPAEVAVPLLPLLIRPELREVLTSPGVPAIVRAAAKELMDRRPPVPERRLAQSDERTPTSSGRSSRSPR